VKKACSAILQTAPHPFPIPIPAFRYITVDAYLSAVPFYEKNGFVHLTKKDEDEHTRLMFYDMMEVG
jgi:hypothetical protein